MVCVGFGWIGVLLAWPDSIVAFRLRSTRRGSRGSIEFHQITLPFRARFPPPPPKPDRVEFKWSGLGWFGVRLNGAGMNWTGCNCVAGGSGRLHWAPHACRSVD